MPTVTLDDGRAAHLAPASTGDAAPGVVVLHEIFGLEDDVRGLADRLGALGFLALAPDLYAGGSWWRGMRTARRELHAGEGAVFDAIAGAADWLARRPECSGRLGVMGVSLGGGLALRVASRHGFAAAGAAYGEVPEDAEAALAGACPVVASFGARDRTLRGHAERLGQALTRLGVPHDVTVHPGAGHGFLRERGYPGLAGPLSRVNGMAAGPRPAAAAEAWRRIGACFDAHLR